MWVMSISQMCNLLLADVYYSLLVLSKESKPILCVYQSDYPESMQSRVFSWFI